MDRLAVIDMGSNSFRLVVYDYEAGVTWAVTDEIREAVRVGQGLDATGKLSEEAMGRAGRTAEVFAAFCRASRISDVDAVATSAIRDAQNRRALLGRMRKATGLDPRVLSPEEEARYAWIAIVNSTTIEDGLGLDIGGGSVQLMDIRERRLVRTASWPLGAIRVSERFLPGERATKKGMKALRKEVASATSGWEGERIAAVGGTVRNLASAALKREGVELVDVQGYILSRGALGELIEELASHKPEDRGQVPGIKPDRGDVILGGAVVLDALLDAGGFDGVEVTEAGLREGIFLERYLSERPEPLFENVRRASVLNLARRFHYEPRHQEHVARLSLEVYDGLADAGLLEAVPAERELLWAACLLHDTGAAIDYDDHHKHSRYLILSSGLPGFSPRELELVALIARYHRKGEPDASELGPLWREGDDRLLAALAGILRVAEQLERSRDGSVRAVGVDSENGAVTLRAQAVSDDSVPVWSARRSADLLASAVGRDVEVVGEGR